MLTGLIEAVTLIFTYSPLTSSVPLAKHLTTLKLVILGRSQANTVKLVVLVAVLPLLSVTVTVAVLVPAVFNVLVVNVLVVIVCPLIIVLYELILEPVPPVAVITPLILL